MGVKLTDNATKQGITDHVPRLQCPLIETLKDGVLGLACFRIKRLIKQIFSKPLAESFQPGLVYAVCRLPSLLQASQLSDIVFLASVLKNGRIDLRRFINHICKMLDLIAVLRRCSQPIADIIMEPIPGQ